MHIGPLCPVCGEYVMSGHPGCWDLGPSNEKEVKCRVCGTELFVWRFLVPQIQIDLADRQEVKSIEGGK